MFVWWCWVAIVCWRDIVDDPSVTWFYDLVSKLLSDYVKNYLIDIVSLLLFLPPLSERRRYCVARRHAVMLCVCVCVCVRRISLGGEGNALYPVLSSHHHLASREGIVSLGVRLSRCVCVRRISLGGIGNELYPMLSS